MLRYLVTGANGFVGLPLCLSLLRQGAKVRGSVRQASIYLAPGIETYVAGSIHDMTDWQAALTGIDCVIHLAATVHRPDIQDPVIYKTTITDASTALFKQAIAAGVKRFIYVSTSHVYGVEGSLNLIGESCVRNPCSSYGHAKMEAEDNLLALGEKSAIELVIVRPPLIYGPGVGGNMAQLINLVRKLPILPLGLAEQKRSFVGLDNFIAFLQLCAENPQAANKIFNISDDHDLSTRELCEILAKSMGKKLSFISVSPKVLRFVLKTIGKEAVFSKLFEPLRLDITQAKLILGWHPPFSVEQQFQKMLAGGMHE